MKVNNRLIGVAGEEILVEKDVILEVLVEPCGCLIKWGLFERRGRHFVWRRQSVHGLNCPVAIAEGRP